MSATAFEVDVRQEVYTKEELQALRRKLRGRTSSGGAEHEPPSAAPDQDPPDWGTDVELIIKFLRDLDKIMKFLVENRIPDPPRRLFQLAIKGLVPNLDDAIAQLESIDSETHETYGLLKGVGLALENLLAKLDTLRDGITRGPVLAVLDAGDKILGSLCKVLPILEPMKEMKEMIEYRVKYGGDAEIIGLGL